MGSTLQQQRQGQQQHHHQQGVAAAATWAATGAAAGEAAAAAAAAAAASDHLQVIISCLYRQQLVVQRGALQQILPKTVTVIHRLRGPWVIIDQKHHSKTQQSTKTDVISK